MRPLIAAFAACVIAGVGAPTLVHAQTWNDPRTMNLVDRAIARRAAQLADTGLTDYRANAHGFLTFLAQIGEGYPDPPKVVRTDELALEVYWRAPNQSKQRIVGRRDTLLLPTDIAYHRDHLAIVQNNFPGIIRLGDGDEVRDVPHPLSTAGRDAYDFAIVDSLRIKTQERAFDVLTVNVRPRDDQQPRAIGAVYLDRETGSVVRMAVSFTRVALKDPQLEDVSVILENGLFEGRFWLPRRQEIEIRRTATWMDFPTRGIIRGRWEICCVQVNQKLPAPWFAGEEVVSLPPAQLKAYKFDGGILEVLPGDLKLSADDDVRHVQDAARELVRAEALSRAQSTTPSARGVSDVVRFDRNEGLAIGAGLAQRFGAGVVAKGRARFGLDDHQLKHELSLGWLHASGAGLSITAHDDWRDAGDEAETSGVRNSIAAQEFGSDFTDSYRARGVQLALDAGNVGGLLWRVTAERAHDSPLALRARPAVGAFRPAFGAVPLTVDRISLSITRALSDAPWGSRGQGAFFLEALQTRDVSSASHSSRFARLVLTADAEHDFGTDKLALHTTAAAIIGAAPPAQWLVHMGGPVTGPGYDFHQFAALGALSQRVEWRHLAGALPLSLGRFGTMSMPVVIAPFAQGIWLQGEPGAQQRGWYGSVGVGVISLFDLLRLDVARGMRDGRWTFSVDMTRGYWRVL
ncbi:MAG: hypothetical protein NTZ43_02875 [Gemmatimonadetes bacterium]|nr:hypothetical protein [Gemmatimonadota bacterium]